MDALVAIRAEKALALARVKEAEAAVRAAQAEVAKAESKKAQYLAPRPPPSVQQTAKEESRERMAGGDGSSSQPVNEESRECMDGGGDSSLSVPTRGPARGVSYRVALSIGEQRVYSPRTGVRVVWKVTLGDTGCTSGSSGRVEEVVARPEENDFIGIYPAGKGGSVAGAHEEHMAIEFTEGALEGGCTLTLPSAPLGEYDVCYFSSDGVECGRVPLTSAMPLTPQYLLEVQPHISVFQVSVHFAAAHPLSLPPTWAPSSIRLEGDGGPQEFAPHALLLRFELPRRPGHESGGSERGVVGVDGKGGERGGRGTWDAYTLRLPLSRRGEGSKVVWRHYPDFLSIRLPMYYTGSAEPDKPPSLVSLEEMRALAGNVGEGACVWCSAPLFKKAPSAAAAAAAAAGAGESGGGGTVKPRRLKALRLPSEHWLELREFWLCHDAEVNCLLPSEGEGDTSSIEGVVMVGETHLQPHLKDILQGALHWEREGGEKGKEEDSVQPFRTVTCGRCGSQLGSLHAASAAPVAGEEEEEEEKGGGEGEGVGKVCTIGDAFDAAAIASLPPVTFATYHPTLRLFKDRLCVPNPGPHPRTLPDRLPPNPANALSHYTLTSRVAAAMLAASQVFMKYVFAVRDVEVGGGDGGDTLATITLVNWNTSIRAGGGGGGVDKGVAWGGGVPGDLACLKVFYREGAGAGGGGTTLPSSHLHPYPIWITGEEGRELLATLQESTLLLPPSLRAGPQGQVGFLPFLANPLRKLYH